SGGFCWRPAEPRAFRDEESADSTRLLDQIPPGDYMVVPRLPFSTVNDDGSGRPSMEFGLKGRVALVPAASKGIGYGVAKVLASEGCKVVISSRNQDSIRKATEQIVRETGNREDRKSTRLNYSHER